MSTGKEYEKYKQLRITLEKMISDGAKSLEKLGINQHAEGLNTLAQKVAGETFRIMILGQFKTGKSTFINSFLGDEILPAYVTPCTAIINEVKYAQEKKAILFFRNPLPEKLPSEISSEIAEHIHKERENIPPIEIPFDEIEDYVVIPMGKELKESLLESPYDKVELYWPLDLLENGVEIIDSPGLNEHETRTRVTLQYLLNADATIFLLTSLAPCGKAEMDFIENNLHRSGFNDIFFIFNRFDQLPPKERDRLKNFGLNKLKGETSFGERGIFFISAYDALMGKMNNNLEQLEKSGIVEFEKVLSDFLINQRGKTKLTQPAKELKRIISEAIFTTIPGQKSMLNTSLAEIEQKYAEAKPRLEQLEVRKQQMSNRIELSIERMLPDIRRCIQDYFNSLNERIPLWLSEIELENEFQAMHPKESSERIITELLEKIQGKIEYEQLGWQNEQLLPVVSEKIEIMKEAIEANIENFYIELDNIKINIAGDCGQKIEGAKDVSAIERVGAAALGFFAGDIGAAAIGGNFGFSKTFFTQLATQIGAVVGMLLLGISNPLTMLPVIIGIAVVGFIRGKVGVIDQLKEKTAKGVIEELNKISGQSIEAIMGNVKDRVQEIGNGIIHGLESEISTVKEQVESIIRDIKAGEAEVANKRDVLEKCESNLVRINQDLDDFILALLQNN